MEIGDVICGTLYGSGYANIGAQVVDIPYPGQGWIKVRRSDGVHRIIRNEGQPYCSPYYFAYEVLPKLGPMTLKAIEEAQERTR